jgi:murein DD-endopeptidase MepM/ murein hydrolase activator NlpD
VQKQLNMPIKLWRYKNRRLPDIRRRLRCFARVLLSIVAILVLDFNALCKEKQPSPLLPQNYAIVQHGDTLATVAQRYHSTPEKLIQYNGIKPPYKIYIGQPLKLSLSVIADKHAQIYIKEIQPTVPQSLCKPEKNLQVPNHKPLPLFLPSSNILKPLKKPQSGRFLPEGAMLSTSDANLKPQLVILPSRKPEVFKNSKELQPSSEIQKSKTIKLPLAQPNPPSGQNFLWPLKGKILSEFGTKSSLKYNRGINISAILGDCVVACENGIVAYAGNEIKGFGNMILIKHANGWMSAYAHNRHLLVSRGDKVQRGQKIAEAGATGNVKEPQLHFELRQKTRAVDPQKYLGY